MKPGPDNIETNECLITFLAEEMRRYPDLELESTTRHDACGSEIDVAYPRRWRRLPLPRLHVTLLAKHDGVIIKTRSHL
jgi:hypothetical protein